ncbi:hypothetical protein HYDPIDRAFT_33958 [Hydnomerulius pinastri MD-312]|uniref:Unplaced genomic scaffold scaffold_84, whole genome shotgun sequence n=1 Tax=Hydnomerulius pinastri MD-312 TaxID=994086 RepID=A0A0C9W758_9AGAM|nr:hypothetical protein HYDPIDRAFT_33958 [Hydnomerulius pinastri MD-312]
MTRLRPMERKKSTGRSSSSQTPDTKASLPNSKYHEQDPSSGRAPNLSAFRISFPDFSIPSSFLERLLLSAYWTVAFPPGRRLRVWSTTTRTRRTTPERAARTTSTHLSNWPVFFAHPGSSSERRNPNGRARDQCFVAVINEFQYHTTDRGFRRSENNEHKQEAKFCVAMGFRAIELGM